ncbi:hypothetical protein GCM10009416_45380 [Craurococcus roseus]|uniref:HAF repeat-containing protein n=1 Tax=Craurococcus roseus TaxID=77585 RepID=A0ABP3R9J7_9PROT
MATEEPPYGFSTVTLPGIAAVPQLSDINNKGDIVGFYDANGEHGFLLREGQVTTLDVPGASSTAASGVNDAGDIVGTYLAESGNDVSLHGFLYSDGAFTTLDIPGAGDTQLNGINDRGQIVAFTPASDPPAPSGGFLYENGVFTRITVPDRPDAFLVPLGINDEGAIVGISGNQGFVLEGGQLTLIDNPFSQFPIRPEDVNNEGQVVGSLAPLQRASQGFLYENGEITAFGPPVPPNQPPSAGLQGINDAGEIVGNSSGGGPGRAFAFLATPEAPAAVDWDAVAARVQANFAATGRWFVGDEPPLPADVDWHALAARVTANFEATGQWFA